jgi:hypothetical protein
VVSGRGRESRRIKGRILALGEMKVRFGVSLENFSSIPAYHGDSLFADARRPPEISPRLSAPKKFAFPRYWR